MESELMPCPVCGESCTSYREFAELPAKVQCDVMTCNYALESASRAEGIEQHNTLARRAEIGALVERIVANVEHIPDDGRLFIGHGGLSVGIEDDFGEHRRIAAASLLEALRALAAELEVSGD